jgi:hypothetical protein
VVKGQGADVSHLVLRVPESPPSRMLLFLGAAPRGIRVGSQQSDLIKRSSPKGSFEIGDCKFGFGD